MICKGVTDTTLKVRILPSRSRIEAYLIATAAVAGADLLVMGAYGHSRLRELVLGGATLSALKHPTLPLLMIH